MRRTSVIILSVLALLGAVSIAAASTTIWTSTSVKPVVSLSYTDPLSGKYVVLPYVCNGANFLTMNQDLDRDLFITLSARNSSGLSVMAEGLGMGILLPSGSTTAVLSWQDTLDPLVFDFPHGLSMTAEAAIIKGSYTLNASNTASGNFTLDVAGTLTLSDNATTPARMTATFSSGPMTANKLEGYTTIPRGFTPPPISTLPPIAADQTVPVTFGNAATAINLLAGAESFQTNQTLAATVASPPVNGSLSTVTGGIVKYTPSPVGFVGDDVFLYNVTDAGGLVSSTHKVTVSVTGMPAVQAIQLKVLKNSNNNAIHFSPLNLKGTNVVSSVSNGSNGTVQYIAPQFYYTPNSNFTGRDTLAYTLTNALGWTYTGEVDVLVCPIAANYVQGLGNSNYAQVNVLAKAIPFNSSDTLALTGFPYRYMVTYRCPIAQ